MQPNNFTFLLLFVTGYCLFLCWETWTATCSDKPLVQLQLELFAFPEGFWDQCLIYLWPKSGSWPRLWTTLMSLIKGQNLTGHFQDPEPFELSSSWREPTVQMETHSLHPISPIIGETGMFVCVTACVKERERESRWVAELKERSVWEEPLKWTHMNLLSVTHIQALRCSCSTLYWP